MNRLLGLILFFIGIGMLLCLLIPSAILTAAAAIICIIFGYYMFCC